MGSGLVIHKYVKVRYHAITLVEPLNRERINAYACSTPYTYSTRLGIVQYGCGSVYKRYRQWQRSLIFHEFWRVLGRYSAGQFAVLANSFSSTLIQVDLSTVLESSWNSGAHTWVYVT